MMNMTVASGVMKDINGDRADRADTADRSRSGSKNSVSGGEEDEGGGGERRRRI